MTQIWGIVLGMIVMCLNIAEKKGTFGELIKGMRTRKEDLDVNWKALEEAEKNI